MKLFVFFLMMIFLQSGCYVTKQFYYQGKRLAQRQDIKEVLLDPSTDHKFKEQLLLLNDILEFSAFEGLSTEGAYTKIVMIDEPAVSFVVQAAYPDRLEFVSWWFPIVGRMPYLGYVHKKDRDEMAKNLSLEGYEIHPFEADGFSSLGFFEDPVFSSMLNKSKHHFANLIFHELIHRTFWVKDGANFNENIATYLSHVLTRRFFTKRNDLTSLEKFEAYLKDKETFRTWLEPFAVALEAFYQNPPVPSSDPLWKEKKAEIFSSFLVKHRPKFLLYDFIGTKEWNNADVLAWRMYSPQTNLFDRAFACFQENSVGVFLKQLSAKPEVQEEPMKALSLMCSPH